MINLLPKDAKAGMEFARRNTILRNWLITFCLSILGVGLIVAGGWAYMNKTIQNYNDQIASSEQVLKSQQLDSTRNQAQDITSSLQLVVKVLSREVLFSKLLQQIGQSIPPNAILTGLEIGKLQGGIDLTAKTSNYNTATQVQVNLQDPKNKIFDKADIVSINCNLGNSTTPQYPCAVSIRAQFAKDNPFLLISGGAK